MSFAAASSVFQLLKTNLVDFSGDAGAFPVWKRKFKSSLSFSGINLDRELKVEEDAVVYNLLIMCLQGNAACHVTEVEEGKGKQLFQRLSDLYASGSAENVSTLVSRLLSTKPDSFATVMEYIADLNRTLDQLRATGTDTTVHEGILVVNVCKSLPARFLPITAQAAGSNTRKWSQLTEDLRLFAETFGGSLETAAVPASAPAAAGPCGAYFRKQRSAGRRPFSGTCHFCGTPGHKIAQCDQAKAAARSKVKPVSHFAALGDDVDGTAFSARICAARAAAHMPADEGVERNVLLCVDSGATRHIVSDEFLFETLNKSTAAAVKMANGASVMAAGSGVVKVSAATHDGTPHVLALVDALLLPNGGINLLSVSRLTLAGHAADLNPRRPTLKLHSGIVLPLQHRDGLFWLAVAASRSQPAVLAMPASVEQTVDVVDKRVSPLCRHQRLGHLNAADMRAMGQLGRDEQLPFCASCSFGKSKRQAVSKKAAERTVQPGELTHTDFNGPMEQASLHGHRYAIVYVDHAITL
jgi:hypothetical protein